MILLADNESPDQWRQGYGGVYVIKWMFQQNASVFNLNSTCFIISVNILLHGNILYTR